MIKLEKVRIDENAISATQTTNTGQTLVYLDGGQTITLDKAQTEEFNKQFDAQGDEAQQGDQQAANQ